jgi:H+/Cl- antiporter ClcA
MKNITNLDLARSIINKVATSKIRQNILQALPFWVASILTGLVAVLYARLFAFCEKLSASLVLWHSWILFILTPACFVAAWWIVHKFQKNAGGSGIPQVIAAVELSTPRYNYLVDKLLSTRVIIVKILSTLLMILGGGVIGREGPTIQIAGSIFRKINLLLPASWPRISKKNMIVAGAAAGLAAAFNTPFGGIVFAVEELAKTHISYFKSALFTAVIIAGLTAQGILGPYLYLGYPNVGNVSGYLIVCIVILACICGLLGSFMSVVILKIIHWKRTHLSTKMQLLYVIGCALIIASVAYFINVDILWSGKEEMNRVLFSTDKHVSAGLPFFRIIGSVASFTTGAAGGVFAPALAAGATIGALFADMFNVSAANANILILAGMVAFLTGVTRSPFTCAILVIEMTDRHSVVFSLILAGLIASVFANFVDKHSFYDHLKDRYLKDAYDEHADNNPQPTSNQLPVI